MSTPDEPAAERFAQCLRSLASLRIKETIAHDDAVILEAALWEAAREGGFDEELDKIINDSDV
jgi:hypothetical protein